MRIGFIGSGTIASAMVTGLSSAGGASPIVLSPRNAQVARDLASRFSNVRIGTTNQAVLDACDVVVLSVRPHAAHDVLSALTFRSDHRVLSLIATISLHQLQSAIASADSVTRAVPLPSVARRQGPTAIYPPNRWVSALFDELGTAIELENESEFDAFTAATAVMASYFGLAGTVSNWMTRQGVAPDSAHRFVAQMLRGLAGSAPAPHGGFDLLTQEHRTPGGLNEQVLNQLADKGVFGEWASALDAVLKRIKSTTRHAASELRRRPS